MKFTPDPHLWVKNESTLRYYDEVDLRLLKRAAEKYFEYSPEGRPDLYVWKVIQDDFSNRQKESLWMVFQEFYFGGRLYQLRDWIPD